MNKSRLPADLILFTPLEAAETLHISVSRVRHFVQQGLLIARVHRGMHGSKRLLISEAELRRFVYDYFTTGYWKGKKRPTDKVGA